MLSSVVFLRNPTNIKVASILFYLFYKSKSTYCVNGSLPLY